MYKNNISYWIEEKGVKLKYIADRLKVSYQTVSNWKTNKSQPNLLQAAELAEILNVSPNDLVIKEEELS